MKLSARLAQVIQRYRLVFIILGAAVILFPIVYYVFDSIRQKDNEASAVQDRLVTGKYGEWRQETGEKKDGLEKELFTLVDETAVRFPDRFAGINALSIRAIINEEKMSTADSAGKKELFLSALKDTLRIAENAPDNLLAPQAVMKAAALIQNSGTLLNAEAAVTAEELVKLVPARLLEGNQEPPAKAHDLALALYRFVVSRYAKSMFVPEALLNIGFILEAQGKAQEAAETYRRMEGEFSNSNLTKIAINRKLDLEGKGVLAR